MKNSLISSIILITLILSPSFSANTRKLDDILIDWQLFETGVRDQHIPKLEAKEKLKMLLDELSAAINSRYEMSQGNWDFPLKGYGISAVSKKSFNPGSVYGPYGVKGYDFFDGNRHGGHPAYDIFIKDKKQKSLDDKTKKSVKVLAMTDMLVLSVNNNWQPKSMLRGGNYIWAINTKEKKLLYYAHLRDIFVKPGDYASKGNAMGTVGRTGYSAYKKSSPTHLHLMVLEYNLGELKPFDYYPLLPKPQKKS